jgi:hypothetical protein
MQELTSVAEQAVAEQAVAEKAVAEKTFGRSPLATYDVSPDATSQKRPRRRVGLTALQWGDEARFEHRLLG